MDKYAKNWGENRGIFIKGEFFIYHKDDIEKSFENRRIEGIWRTETTNADVREKLSSRSVDRSFLWWVSFFIPVMGVIGLFAIIVVIYENRRSKRIKRIRRIRRKMKKDVETDADRVLFPHTDKE
ncbi:MAG: hypothetical protein ACXAD7_15495 [Candidatus Kariarchaeaceae archaeon]